MREPADVVSAAFPRPGRVLKAVLITIAASAILGAIIYNWAPGGARGAMILSWVAFSPDVHELWKAWTFVTSGILSWPEGVSHAFFSLIGLYFLGADLEKRWGGARFLRFLAISVVFGNLFVLGVNQLPIFTDFATHAKAYLVFHPPFVLGPTAAITACAMAWSKENATRQIRLFFVLPVTGRTLYWFTIGAAILSPLFLSGAPEGVAAPFGGIVAGLLFSGTPSPVRSAWLRLRLGAMRRRGEPTFEQMMDSSARPRTTAKRAGKGGPPLRVVQGGLDDDKKPPKDKRYLN